MEADIYPDPSPAQTLAEAQATNARLAGLLSALQLRAMAVALVATALGTLTAAALLLSFSAESGLQTALPTGILPSIALLGMYVTYKAVETYLDLIALKRSVHALKEMYDSAIRNASLSMPLGGVS